jgi:hypothetical protein
MNQGTLSPFGCEEIPVMPAQKYLVALSPEQHPQAQIVARSYKHAALERKRAPILLRADTHRPEGAANDQTIAQEVQVRDVTVQNVRKRFAEGALRPLSTGKNKPTAKPVCWMGLPKPA